MNQPSRVRRAVVLVAVATLTLTACGDDDASPAGDASTSLPSAPVAASAPTADAPTATATPTEAAVNDSATRTVDTEFGSVEVPVDPQRIVALDEYAAMNVLALGIEPVVVYGTYNSEVSAAVLDSLGIEVVDASVGGGINFEAVAAETPDLIVASNEPGFVDIDIHGRLMDIAPAVVVPLQEPWRDTIQATATIFDRQAEGDRLIGLLEERIAALAEVRAARAPASVSLLGNILDNLMAVSSKAPLSSLITEVGLTRPVAQSEGEPFAGYESIILLSPETLGEHDADLVAVFGGNDFNAEAVTSLPTFQSLPAVIEGRSVEVDGGMWFGTFPFAIHWILDDLTALVDGDGQAGVGTIDDASTRWANATSQTD